MPLDEHARGKACDHRARIEDADEDTDELGCDAEIAPDFRSQHCRCRGGDRGVDLDRERDRERYRRRARRGAARVPVGTARAGTPHRGHRQCARLGDDGVDGDVVRPHGNAIDELYVEGAGDACGARRDERQETVVVAAAIAKPPPFAIERDARNHDEVDFIGGNSGAVGQRLGNALGVPGRRRARGRQSYGGRASARSLSTRGTATVLPAAMAARTRARGVPFIVKGERHQHALRREKIGARQEARNDRGGSGRPDLRGQRIAFGQHTRSQGGFRVPQRGALRAEAS